MVGYFTRTGTRATLDVLRAARWRPLLTPDATTLPPGFDGYAIDNGVWGATQKGEAWRPDGFLRLVERRGAGADFLVLPDIIAGGRESLDLSLRWLDQLRGACRLSLVAVQDGMDDDDIAPHLAESVGCFLGGSTDWKLATAPAWGALCRTRGAYFHFGRVNTWRRMRLAKASGADSFDGTAASRFTMAAKKVAGFLDATNAQGEMCLH